jgi:phage regulator Rha-like protein
VRQKDKKLKKDRRLKLINNNIMSKNQLIIPDERIINQIYYIRGKKVMFDRDLAELYGVQPKVLNQAVKRKLKRFPDDFMFKLTKTEMEIWKSQFVTSSEKEENSLRSQIVTLKKGRGQHAKYFSYVFTEQGVAMLASILNSDRAVAVNIQIVRTFVKLREILATHIELRQKMESMEKKYDKQFNMVFKVIANLMKEDAVPKNRIGFEG